MKREDKIRIQQLIELHNDMCDSFDKEIRRIMGEINKICKPNGIRAGRISAFEKGKDVTRVHLSSKNSLGMNLDDDWLEILWGEDDKM